MNAQYASSMTRRAVTQQRRRRRRTGAASRVVQPPASVAQWIRHRPPKPRIVGSSPTRGTANSLFVTILINLRGNFDKNRL